jgi:hypothetical protein
MEYVNLNTFNKIKNVVSNLIISVNVKNVQKDSIYIQKANNVLTIKYQHVFKKVTQVKFV